MADQMSQVFAAWTDPTRGEMVAGLPRATPPSATPGVNEVYAELDAMPADGAL